MSGFYLTPPDVPLPPISFESDSAMIYDLYPRKVKRTKALAEIEKALRRLIAGEIGPRLSPSQAVDELKKAVMIFAQSPSGNRGEFTPHPTSWFHQSRYLDDPNEWFHQTTDERMRSLNQVGVWRPS